MKNSRRCEAVSRSTGERCRALSLRGLCPIHGGRTQVGLKLEWVVDEVTGCWNCTSHKPNASGYPVILRHGVQQSVSRHVFKEMFGLPDGELVVRHKCDNRKCINPEHLESGTVAENNKDRAERGRSVTGLNSPLNNSKLNAEQVLFIYRSKESNTELAKIFGMSRESMANIRRGATWRFVTGATRQ